MYITLSTPNIPISLVDLNYTLCPTCLKMSPYHEGDLIYIGDVQLENLRFIWYLNTFYYFSGHRSCPVVPLYQYRIGLVKTKDLRKALGI